MRRLPLFQKMDQTFEDKPAIVGTEEGLAGALGVRHETGDIPSLVANSSDIHERAVRIGLLRRLPAFIHITPENPIMRFERTELILVGEVAPFTMGNGNA